MSVNSHFIELPSLIMPTDSFQDHKTAPIFVGFFQYINLSSLILKNRILKIMSMSLLIVLLLSDPCLISICPASGHFSIFKWNDISSPRPSLQGDSYVLVCLQQTRWLTPVFPALLSIVLPFILKSVQVYIINYTVTLSMSPSTRSNISWFWSPYDFIYIPFYWYHGDLYLSPVLSWPVSSLRTALICLTALPLLALAWQKLYLKKETIYNIYFKFYINCIYLCLHLYTMYFIYKLYIFTYVNYRSYI